MTTSFGGDDEAARGPFTPLGHLPAPSTFTGNTAALVGDKVLLFGTDAPPSSANASRMGLHGRIIEWDLGNQESRWLETRLPEGVTGMAVGSVEGRAYLMGGEVQKRFDDVTVAVPVNKTWSFDPASGRLQQGPDLPIPIIRPTMAQAGEKLFLFGGAQGPGRSGLTDTIIRFEPLTGDTEVLETSLPTPRAGMGAATTDRGIFLFGGITPEDNLPDVLRFDPSTGKLHRVESQMAYPRVWPTVAAFDDSVYLIGGTHPTVEPQEGPTAQIERFDPTTEEILLMDGLSPEPRARAAWVATAEGITLFGGVTGCDPLLPTSGVFHYDPWRDRPWNLSDPFQVRPPPIEGSIVTTGLEATFVATGQSCDPWSHTYREIFDWGDGGDRTWRSSHTYERPGQYTVEVVFVGAKGVRSYYEEQIVVRGDAMGGSETSLSANVDGHGSCEPADQVHCPSLTSSEDRSRIQFLRRAGTGSPGQAQQLLPAPLVESMTMTLEVKELTYELYQALHEERSA